MPLFAQEPRELWASQLLFPAYRFGVDKPEEAERLVDLGIGGFCLFGGSKTEVAELTERLQARAKLPLLFCADYERGVGQWVEGATKLACNMAFGAAKSLELAFRKGLVTAKEARALGVDWVLAPVVDLAGRADNPIVNTRAFSDRPGAVARLAGAFLDGLKEGGAMGCLKHFPGHGETSLDSHLELPTLELDMDRLENRELKPYRALARRAEAVMLGHLKVPAIDPDLPASLSPKAVALLRSMGFTGLVLTDALSMGAVVKAHEPRRLAALALAAGADILLVPDDPFKMHAELMAALEAGEIDEARLKASFERLQSAKRLLGPAAGPRPSRPWELDPNEGLDWAAAQEALCWSGKPAFIVEPGGELAYLELGTDGESKAGDFFETLQRLGVRVRPWREDWKGPVVAAVFSSPKAYAGSINLDESGVALIRAVAAARPLAVVAFGSPYVAEQTAAPTLLAFSSDPAFQRAAARVIAGRQEAVGRLPVKLKPFKEAAA